MTKGKALKVSMCHVDLDMEPTPMPGVIISNVNALLATARREGVDDPYFCVMFRHDIGKIRLFAMSDNPPL